MRRHSRALLLPVLLLLIFQQFHLAHAEQVSAPGLPGSVAFGFGATVQPRGAKVPEALALADTLDLDWVSVPVVWAQVQPEPTSVPNLALLDALFHTPGVRLPPVMISLSGAPGWAQTPQGPDPAAVAQFVAVLVKRYPAIGAVELFPGANTQTGWGSAPNPAAYVGLYRAVNTYLRAAGSTVMLIAAGLQPQAAQPPAGTMDDLAFLAGMYQQGAANLMPVISIQYTYIASDPLRYPDGSEHRILRHYEEARQVMLVNKHTTGRIWVTRFSLPSGTIGTQDIAPIDPSAQSAWMIQAATQMRSQLYIGAVFLTSLNSNGEGADSGLLVLLPGEQAQHPFTALLGEMIRLNQADSGSIVPGKAKEGSFEKKRP